MNTLFSSKKIIAGLAAAIILCLTGIAVFHSVSKTHMNHMATGVYSEYRQSYEQDGSRWLVVCDKALTGGAFNHTLPKEQITDTLIIAAQVDNGSLVLRLTQEDKTEEIDIGKTDGELIYDLSAFDKRQDIKISVDHTKAEGIRFEVRTMPLPDLEL